MTQKFLGMEIGFDEKTADVRMAQYESGTRTPKSDLIAKLANTLDVSPKALDIPDIDSDIGLMHTLFALEDLRGLQIGELDGEICLRLDKSRGMTYVGMLDMLTLWKQKASKLKAGEISKDEYDQWRYNYPRIEAERFKTDVDVLRAAKKEQNGGTDK
jgi:transcriptional regulator with XRE-family HTH domain